MTWSGPDYLSVSSERLGTGSGVKVRIGGDQQDVAHLFARSMLQEIRAAQEAGRSPTLIIPVGPVDQFPILAGHINEAAWTAAIWF